MSLVESGAFFAFLLCRAKKFNAKYLERATSVYDTQSIYSMMMQGIIFLIWRKSVSEIFFAGWNTDYWQSPKAQDSINAPLVYSVIPLLARQILTTGQKLLPLKTLVRRF
jgi:hypothetical protein